MVVTSMSFMHIRSTLGLIRHIRREAKHLRREIHSIENLEQQEKAARDSGEIESVKLAWKKLLDSYTKQETILDRITKEQEIEIREEIKTEKQELEQKAQDTKELLEALTKPPEPEIKILNI